MPEPFETTYKVDIASHFPNFTFSKSFQRIQDMLDDQEHVTALLDDLDKEIKDRVQEFQKEDDLYDEAQALYDILRESESRNGFNSSEVKYVTGVLTPKEFGNMLRAKSAFLDPFVTNRHGAETHRIQWWMVCHDMFQNPGHYDEGISAAELYALSISKGTSIPKEQHAAAGERYLWTITFDALQGRCTTARSPESLKEFFNDRFELIKVAEQKQMSWDSCIKWRYSVVQKLGRMATKFEKNQDLKKYP